MGFEVGDEILAFDDYEPQNFGMLQADLVRRKVHTAKVLRGSDTLTLYIDQAMMSRVIESQLMFDIAIPFVIDSVAAGSPNTELKRGDRIISFDGQEVQYLQDSRPVLASLAGREIAAGVIREADTLSIPVQVDSAGRIGVYMRTPSVINESYDNLGEAIVAGIKLTGETINGYLQDLRLLATPSTGAYKSVGSFIAIGQVFPDVWDWYRFMYILALLSIMLGVMNLLPIPGLDGGHILFTVYEIISGKKPSDKFMIAAQWVGMILLLALMLLAFGNDVGRLIK